VLINLGCGTTVHPAWINLDVVPSQPGVRHFDIRDPLPFASDTVDAVYHSHLIEHLSGREATALVKETWRVLKPDGVVRIATPDLEAIGRLYLEKLEQACRNETGAADDYDWMLLELFDQIGRETSGGEMAEYLRAKRNAAFVRSRIGREVDSFLAADSAKPSLYRRVRSVGWMRLPYLLRVETASFVAGIVGGTAARRACQAGLFRQSGEVHRLLYDRFSLGRLLAQAGFSEPRVCNALDSRIPAFHTYNLDTTTDGKTRKPDSFFMEAIKPGAKG
jgi:SAM-dependent methyltransferase